MTWGSVSERKSIKTYIVHVFKGGNTKGTHYEAQAYTIQNLRKNIIAKFKSTKVFVDVYIYTKNGSYVGHLTINPKRKEIYYFNQGDVDKASCVTASTGALKKGVCKSKTTKRK